METTNQQIVPSPNVDVKLKSEISSEELAKLNSLACEIEISTITIGDRIRRDFSHVPDLAESLREDGLIQPIVLTYDRTLIAGESRIRAAKSLGWTTIRAVFRGVLSPVQLGILEATENNARKGLTWQERCLSVDKVHRLRSTDAALKGETWTLRETGRLLGQGKSAVQYCTYVAEFLHANDVEIWKADALTEAFRILCKREEVAANKLIVADLTKGTAPMVKYVGPVLVPPTLTDDELFSGPPPTGAGFTIGVSSPDEGDEMPGGVTIQPPLNAIPVIELSKMLLKGDSRVIIKTFPDESFDHVITDWPYGNDPDMFIKDIESTKAEHWPEYCRQLHTDLTPEFFRLIRPGGFFITWTDTMEFQRDYDLAVAAGFSVQRWPLIWHKTSGSANQAAQYNFTKNYEVAIVCRKGGSVLNKQQPSSIWTGGNDMETKLLGHPFAKPFGLWDWLFQAVARKGQTVLDPCAGAGSSVIPAIRFGLHPVAIELVEEHYNKMMVNVSNVYRSIDPKVQFK